MLNFEELMKQLDALPDCSDDEDDENSVELKISAKKKETKPASLDQLFDELIRKYNFQSRNDDEHKAFLESFGRLDDMDPDAKKKQTDVSETVCKIKMAARDYLNVSDEKGERFILLPKRNGTEYEIGSEYLVFTEQFKGHSFLLCDCKSTELEQFSAILDGADPAERCSLIQEAKADPDGFALWGKLGKVKRADRPSGMLRRLSFQKRAEAFLCRIPLERNDLYEPVSSMLTRYMHGPSNERADREEALLTMMKLISAMLSPRRPEPLTAESLADVLGKAKVTVRETAKSRAQGWLPNILIVGGSYADAVAHIRDTGRTLNEIPLGGVQGNDYLFGDEMSYYCSGHGELLARLIENNSFPSTVLFSDIDLMGTTVRSSDPLYGLAALLRRHSFQDFYLRGLTINASNIQFICQVNRLEDCPELLLREMDLVVEL